MKSPHPMPYYGPPARCTGCNRTPDQIPIYVDLAEVEEMAGAEDYVWHEEGTLNRENGHFLCDECYIKAGMPSSPGGWIAP